MELPNHPLSLLASGFANLFPWQGGRFPCYNGQYQPTARITNDIPYPGRSSLPNETVHYILDMACDTYPEIRASLRLVSSWVRIRTHQRSPLSLTLRSARDIECLARFSLEMNIRSLWIHTTYHEDKAYAHIHVPTIFAKFPGIQNFGGSVPAFLALFEQAKMMGDTM